MSGNASEEVNVGDIEPGIDPEPTEKAVWGKYTLHRGRKVYELKNHLGNVLAVGSDVKIGVDLQLVNVPLVDYYVADVVEKSKRGTQLVRPVAFWDVACESPLGEWGSVSVWV